MMEIDDPSQVHGDAEGFFVVDKPEVAKEGGGISLEGTPFDIALNNAATILGVQGAVLKENGLVLPATIDGIGSVCLWVAGGGMPIIQSNNGSAIDLSGALKLVLIAPASDTDPNVQALLDDQPVTLSRFTDGVSLQSDRFPNVLIRMDGSHTHDFQGDGTGTVNCQLGAGAWEKFRLMSPGDGSVAIQSAAFPGVFLRLDGSGVVSYNPYGGGTVNCQYGAGPWERFGVEAYDNGRVAFRSLAFPGVYLRLDGTDTTSTMGDGSGWVNAQFQQVSSNELFVLGTF